jgi:hypothetical protein
MLLAYFERAQVFGPGVVVTQPRAAMQVTRWASRVAPESGMKLRAKLEQS